RGPVRIGKTEAIVVRIGDTFFDAVFTTADARKAEIARLKQEAEIARLKAAARESAKRAGPDFPTAPIAVKFKRAQPNPNDIAVIIGNANYTKLGKDIPNVIPAYADAAGFKRYAIQALGIREGNIIDLKDASSAQLVRVFGSEKDHRGQLYDWTRPGESRVFVYYAGHGAPAGADGSAYIVPSDADGSRIQLNGYPLSVLYNNLSKVPAKSMTVVLEACFSGAAQGGAVISNASPVFAKAKTPPVPANITVIAAGGANQMASWERDKSSGLFTKYFLKGMSGEADTAETGNGDGRVDYAELERYLERTLTYFARRHYGRDQTAQIMVGQ
ncbi:MAG: caspase family protein, partial [Rhodospirillales bacterium]